MGKTKSCINITKLNDNTNFILEGNKEGLLSLKEMINDCIESGTQIEFQDYCESNIIGLECTNIEYIEPKLTVKEKIFEKSFGILLLIWFLFLPIIGLITILSFIL